MTMGKRYDPDNTDLLPAKAQKALDQYVAAMLEAEQQLINKWFALSNKDWAFTVGKMEERIADGEPGSQLFHSLIEAIKHERGKA